jgi:hypothetical protein
MEKPRYVMSTAGAVPAVPRGPARWDPAASHGGPVRGTPPAGPSGLVGRGSISNGPVVVLSYAHSGAGWVQNVVASGTDLACTSGTGIVPLCAAAAETWRRVEGGHGQPVSSLATSVVRGLVGAQVTVILAGSGKSRWCELSTVDVGAAGQFLRVYPQASFVCVHRRCLDMVGAGVQVNRREPYTQGLAPYLLAYPGNSVAALSAYWADATEELLAFERANPGAVRRIRYEDVIAAPRRARATVRDWLGLDERQETWAERFDSPASDPQGRATGAGRPAEMIPELLRLRINRLQAEIGYPPLGERT